MPIKVMLSNDVMMLHHLRILGSTEIFHQSEEPECSSAFTGHTKVRQFLDDCSLWSAKEKQETTLSFEEYTSRKAIEVDSFAAFESLSHLKKTEKAELVNKELSLRAEHFSIQELFYRDAIIQEYSQFLFWVQQNLPGWLEQAEQLQSDRVDREKAASKAAQLSRELAESEQLLAAERALEEQKIRQAALAELQQEQEELQRREQQMILEAQAALEKEREQKAEQAAQRHTELQRLQEQERVLQLQQEARKHQELQRLRAEEEKLATRLRQREAEQQRLQEALETTQRLEQKRQEEAEALKEAAETEHRRQVLEQLEIERAIANERISRREQTQKEIENEKAAKQESERKKKLEELLSQEASIKEVMFHRERSAEREREEQLRQLQVLEHQRQRQEAEATALAGHQRQLRLKAMAEEEEKLRRQLEARTAMEEDRQRRLQEQAAENAHREQLAIKERQEKLKSDAKMRLLAEEESLKLRMMNRVSNPLPPPQHHVQTIHQQSLPPQPSTTRGSFNGFQYGRPHQ